MQCIFSVGLYYNHIGKEVYMTCKTNDPDPSFKIEKWRVSKVFGRNNDLIYYDFTESGNYNNTYELDLLY
jgi:hypothetical protein